MEGDAGTSRLNPTDGQDVESDPPPVETQDQPTEGLVEDGDVNDGDVDVDDAVDDDVVGTDIVDTDGGPVRRQERFGRGWLVGICVVLVALTAGVAVGGYFALRSHDRSAAIAAEDAVALARAQECVAATQAPDVAAMTASQSKIIECATGDFGVQANFFTGMLVEAYQAANVAVQVSEMHGAVEKHNDDGSVDVLVAVRVKVTNSQTANQETGYRLRVNMAPADGTYKINRLDQVTS